MKRLLLALACLGALLAVRTALPSRQAPQQLSALAGPNAAALP